MRDPASRAVIALRNALEKTQQQFAVEIVKTSIGTVGVWETTRPPRGETLLKLAEIASQHGLIMLSYEFEMLFLDGVLPRLKMPAVYRRREDGSVYMLFHFPDRARAAFGPELLNRWSQRLAEQCEGPAIIIDLP